MLYIYSADRHFESTNDAQIDLRRGPMVEAQHPTEALGAFDGARYGFGAVPRLDQLIIDPLVIPLPMIVSGILASRLSQRPFAEEDHSIETLILDRSDESLGVGVQVGRAVRQTYDFDAGILQEIPERDGELGVPVEDEEPFIGERSVDWIGKIPADLQHPRFTWTGRDTSDVDATRCEFDHEEHVNVLRPRGPHTSTVKKSAAASTFQWALRNWLHVVRLPRSGAGSIPFFSKMLLIVVRPTR